MAELSALVNTLFQNRKKRKIHLTEHKTFTSIAEHIDKSKHTDKTMKALSRVASEVSPEHNY